MSVLASFTFESHALRIIDQEGAPWFVLKDLLRSMGSRRHTPESIASVKEGLGDGYVNEVPIPDALGRRQPTTIIAEPAATFLVARSNTDQGRRLNRFIHTEVLPAIRKSGGYQAPAAAAAPTKTLDLARYTQLLEAENTLLRERAAGGFPNKATEHLSTRECAVLLNEMIGDAAPEVSHG